MSVADLDSVELQLDDDEDEVFVDDRCIRNRINDFINAKLRGKLQASDEYRTSDKFTVRRRNRNQSNVTKTIKSEMSNYNYKNVADKGVASKEMRSSEIFTKRDILFRPVTAIMTEIQKNKGRYTDIVSVQKARSRRKSKGKLGKDPVIHDVSSSDSDLEEMQSTEVVEEDNTLEAEYWQSVKLMRLIRGCNPSTTVLCLCALRANSIKSIQKAVLEAEGIQILLNLSCGTDLRCRLASMKLLRQLSEILQNAKIITLLDGVHVMVEMIRNENYDLKLLAADILARICHFNHARSKLRVEGGIDYLVCLLDISVSGGTSIDDCTKLMLRCPQFDYKVGKASACALWACSRSTKNRAAMREAGIIPILGRLLKANDSDFLVPVIGTLQECASDRHYQIGIRTEEMVPGLVEHLKTGSKWLKVQCATAFFKCGEDEAIQTLIRQAGGLQPLADMIRLSMTESMAAFASAGAVWKVAISTENAKQLETMEVTQHLVSLLKVQPTDLVEYVKISTAASKRLVNLDHIEATFTNICGAISEMVKVGRARRALRASGGLELLTDLMGTNSAPLLSKINVTLLRCIVDPECLEIIESRDGVRRLISMLRHSDPFVQASAAMALRPCIQASPTPGVYVRTFVGGLLTAVMLLDSRNEGVLISGCALLAEIAKDDENLATITDLGVVPVLADLVHSSNDALRARVAEAIANCCSLDKNARTFGEEGVVEHIVANYLQTNDPDVRLNATRALHRLSSYPINAHRMNNAAVLRAMIHFLGSSQEDLQVSAVGTIGNIRRLSRRSKRRRK